MIFFKIQDTSKEQMQLNKQLLDACLKEKIDLVEIENLINIGAEPLGLFDSDEVVFNEIIYDRSYDDDSNDSLYQITKLFLNNGMEIKQCNLYREGNKGDFLDPFWDIGFLSPVKAIQLIDLLINENTEIDLIEDLISHLHVDSTYIGSELSEVAIYIRIMMYLATNPYVLCNSEYLRDLIDIKHNDYDINIFKQQTNYYIQFDESNVDICNNVGLVVNFYDSKTEKQIWKITLGVFEDDE